MSLLANSPQPVHFVGIAGAGMSALAELLHHRGVIVSGCDANPQNADDLRQLGIEVLSGHDPSHVTDARALVVTSAMPHNHPELARAREHGIPVIRRAEALAEAVSGGQVVGISGTHGKTTTTVMTTEALRAAGLAPTGIAGGRVGSWNGNLSIGEDRLFVVEADEYDRSFLALRPTVAAVTNIEADHLDIYADLDDIRQTFARYVEPAQTIVLCNDDPGAASLSLPTGPQVIRYAISDRSARLTTRNLRAEEGGSAFEAIFDGEAVAAVRLKVPGEHNVRNALAALACGLALGAGAARLAEGLAGFTGVERRFQRLGEAAGVLVIDDYAHHPTEILATLSAARSAFPARRILAAFQPHLFSRTRDLAREFGAALAGADLAFLTEIYPAREQPIEGVSSDLIAAAAVEAGRRVAWRGDRRDLARALGAAVQPGDVVLTMGAGDITRTGPELLELLGRPA
jgi:UDP-N-acetylmuramate--alanine ligase